MVVLGCWKEFIVGLVKLVMCLTFLVGSVSAKRANVMLPPRILKWRAHSRSQSHHQIHQCKCDKPRIMSMSSVLK